MIEQITPDLLESRIESIAALLTIIFAATASLEKIRDAAEQLAASSKRRILLLLMIRELAERDMELAKQVALMLPANHPALSWAFGEELTEARDRQTRSCRCRPCSQASTEKSALRTVMLCRLVGPEDAPETWAFPVTDRTVDRLSRPRGNGAKSLEYRDYPMTVQGPVSPISRA